MPAIRITPETTLSPEELVQNTHGYAPVPESVGEQVESAARDSYLNWAKDRQHGLTVLLQRLNALCEEDEEECCATEPTPYAADIARRLLSDAYRYLSLYFPQGWVSLDWKGGIRIEWSRGGRSERLVVPPQREGQHYIY